MTLKTNLLTIQPPYKPYLTHTTQALQAENQFSQEKKCWSSSFIGGSNALSWGWDDIGRPNNTDLHQIILFCYILPVLQ